MDNLEIEIPVMAQVKREKIMSYDNSLSKVAKYYPSLGKEILYKVRELCAKVERIPETIVVFKYRIKGRKAAVECWCPPECVQFKKSNNNMEEDFNTWDILLAVTKLIKLVSESKIIKIKQDSSDKDVTKIIIKIYKKDTDEA